MLDRSIAVLGLALSIIGPVLAIVYPGMSKRVAWAVFSLGLILVAAAAGIIFLPAGAETQPQPSINGNCNGNNSGTFMNNDCRSNFNILPGRMHFSENVGQEILRNVPRDKPIRLIVVGSVSDFEVGNQIYSFMMSSGYDVSMMRVGQYVPVPDHAITFLDGANRSLIIAPSAH